MLRWLLSPLDRYVLGEWTKIFLGTALGFPLIITIFDLTDNLDKYLNRHLEPPEIALSYVYWLPESLLLVLPAAVLFATVFSIGAFTFETMQIRWTGELIFAMAWLVFVLSVAAIALMYWLLRRSAAVLDLVYRRDGPTPWVRLARTQGRRAADGLPVLIAQGARSFERWFGIAPDRDAMWQAVRGATESR